MASYSICLLPVFVIVTGFIGPTFSMMTPVMIRDLLAMGEPPLTPFAEGQDISRECKADLAKLVRERPIGKIALALDATGKPEAGFLVGHWAWLGHFDECMAIEDFRYCLSYVSLQLPVTQFGVPLQWGLCTPESCSDTDVRNSLDFFFDLLSAPFNNSEVSATGVICSDDPPAPFTPGFWGTLSLILCFAVLMIAGALQDEIRIWNSTGIHGITTSPKSPQDASVSHNGIKKAAEVSAKVEEVTTNLDIAIQADLGEDNEGFKMEIDSYHDVRKDDSQSNDNGKALEEKTTEITMDKEGENVSGGVTGVIIRIWNEVAHCFAFNRNLESLMDTRTTSATIRCLDGIRVLSMTWIILGHVPAFLMENGFYANAPFALEMLRHFGFQVVVNAYFAVDSFFFLSGLLVTYMTLKRMVKTKGRIPWFWFYFQRYCRLTPAMAVSMLIWIYLRPLLGNGPKWPNQVMNHRCGDDWWANFLYINNFVGGMCISWVWYLANDFQFFVISPIFIVLLYRKPKIGFGALSFTCLASFTTTAVLMVVNEFNARLNGMLDPNTSGAEFQNIVYVKPYCRIPPYLVGMAVGYLLHIYRDKRITMHPMLALLGWIAATALGMTCVYGFYPSYHGNELTVADSAAYVALSKFAWAVSLAWVVIACHHGYGGWINSLLSWKFWMPLSRLSYSNYLLHPIILTIITFNFRSTYFYSNSMFVFGVAGIIILSYGSALFLWISVEFPFSNLVKSLMESSQKKRK